MDVQHHALKNEDSHPVGYILPAADLPTPDAVAPGIGAFDPATGLFYVSNGVDRWQAYLPIPTEMARGDVLYYNGTTFMRLPAGNTGQVLTTHGADQDPAWATPAPGGVTDHGALTGLGDDDHTQYHTTGRAASWHAGLTGGHVTGGDAHDHHGGDGAPLPDSALVSGTVVASTGVPDAGKLVKLAADGQIDPSCLDLPTGVTDHGALTGLGDDDHPQYQTTGRAASWHAGLPGQHVSGGDAHDHHGGDGAPLPDTALVSGTVVASTGAADAGKLVKLAADGQIDPSCLDLPASVTDHGALTGLGDDDHAQYLTNARGDARYYTQTQLNGGQLDTRYYTETELQTSGQAAVHWGNLTNKPATFSPAAHAASHAAGQADAVTPAAIGAIPTPGSAAQGDVLIRNAGGWTRLPAGTNGQVLKTQGAGADPLWANESTGGGGFPRYEFEAESFLSPNNSDWVTGTGFATLEADATYNAILVRAFDDGGAGNTTIEGVGFGLHVPTGATQVTFTVIQRAKAAQGAPMATTYKLHVKRMPLNGAVVAFDAGHAIGTFLAPMTANYYWQSATVNLADAGLTAGEEVLCQLNRDPSAGGDPTGDVYLRRLIVTFA